MTVTVTGLELACNPVVHMQAKIRKHYLEHTDTRDVLFDVNAPVEAIKAMDSVATASQQLFIDGRNRSHIDAVLYTLLAANHTEDEEAVLNIFRHLDNQLNIMTRS